MHLFPSRKNRVIPTLAQSIPPPRQNLYSAYNRLIPSPPPPPFIEGNGSAYHKSIIEKYSKGKTRRKNNQCRPNTFE
jgi:hypothetical protein